MIVGWSRKTQGMVSESPRLVGNWKERLWAYLRRYQMVAFRLGPHVLFLILHVHILCLLCLSCCYYLMFLLFFCSTWLPLACRPGSLLLTPTAVCAFHPQLHTNILFYSTPTSVPWHLFHQLLQSNSLIYTFTTFTTQYSPFLFTYIHIIAHHPASLPSTQSPQENTHSTGIEIPIKVMNKFYRCLRLGKD